MRTVMLLLALISATPSVAAGQIRGCATVAVIDSLYFSLDPLASWKAVRGGPACGTEDRERRWRGIRALVALGMTHGSREERNHWLDLAIGLADQAKHPGPPTVDELFWGAAAEGRRALTAGARQAAEFGTQARDDARLLLAVDSLHGGAHNVLGKVAYEVNRLGRIQRLLGRLALGGRFPGGLGWDDAEYHLRRAAELQPDVVLYQVDVAVLLVNRDRAEEARPYLERALALPERHPADARWKADARSLLGRLDPSSDSIR